MKNRVTVVSKLKIKSSDRSVTLTITMSRPHPERDGYSRRREVWRKWVLEAKSFDGLATDLLRSYRFILEAFEDSMIMRVAFEGSDPVMVTELDRYWFNTGNDHKFVSQWLDFLGSIV